MNLKDYLLTFCDDDGIKDEEDVTFKIGLTLTFILISISSIIISSIALGQYILATSFSLGLIQNDLISCCIRLLEFIYATKLCLELLLLYLVVYFGLQHVLGFALTVVLNNLLLKPSGAFNFSIEAVSIRLGLEECEILVRNFIWKNPPQYSRTPYFLKVGELVLQVTSHSVIDAVRKYKAIKVDYLELKNMQCNMEKGVDASASKLNLWSAIGADTPAAEALIRKKYEDSLKKAPPKGALNKMISSVKEKGQASGGPPAPAEQKQVQVSLEEEKEVAASDSDEDLDEDGVQDDLADMRRQKSVKQGAGTGKLLSGNKHAAISKAKAIMRSGHWGVPYKFEVDLFSLRGLKLYAQDLVTAGGSVDEEAFDPSRAIKISCMTMKRRDLTTKVAGFKNRQGLYLDDLVWRLIGGLGNELFATNKMAMSTLLASAAASHTTALAGAVVSTALDSLYTYGPKKLLAEARRASMKMPLLGSSSRGQLLCSPAPSAGVSLYKVSALSVQLLGGRDLRLEGRPLSACFCTVALVAAGQNMPPEAYQTCARTPTAGTVEWQESTELGLVLSLDMQLRIMLFEASLLGSDTYVGEVLLQLGEGIQVSEADCAALLEEDKELDRSEVELQETDAGGLFAVRRVLGVRWPVTSWHSLSVRDLSCAGELQLSLRLH